MLFFTRNNIKYNKSVNEINLSEKCIIPKNIYQTWYTLDLPPYLKECVENIKNMNPEFNHYLYDDKMCREFIKQNFSEDILYVFDKLKPGAYKADLWRYCILYVNGGIYIDIKFKCNEKLINFLDQEYYVKDRNTSGITGIYQAFMINKKNNLILKKSINTIVNNCLNNDIRRNPLDLTGPHLLTDFIEKNTINNLLFYNTGSKVYYKDKNILYYHENNYRNEQNQLHRKNKKYYYDFMWRTLNIYNYKNIDFDNDIELTKKIENTFILSNYYPHLYSSNPSIIFDKDNNIIVNMRYINYKYTQEGFKENIPKIWLSINSTFKITNYNSINIKIGDEFFFNTPFLNNYDIGLGDIKLFYYNDNLYYYSSCFDKKNKNIKISLHNYDNNLKHNIVNTSFENIRLTQKNWSYVYDNIFIHSWYPIKLCKYNNKLNQLDLFKSVKTPEKFRSARGNCPGILIGNYYYFILHKVQKNIIYKKIVYNYVHFIVCLSKKFNIIKHSEYFKFKDKKVEFCLGMIYDKDNNNILFSYSCLDHLSYISYKNFDSFESSLKWYYN